MTFDNALLTRRTLEFFVLDGIANANVLGPGAAAERLQRAIVDNIEEWLLQYGLTLVQEQGQ